MKCHRVLVSIGITVALAATVIAQSNSSTPLAEWNFDKDEAGKTPAAWRVAETKGSGKTGKWIVVADDTAPSKPNMLKLDTQAEGGTFNLLIAEKTSYKDLDLRARVKALSGNEDQGGGLIWRAKDENNYYVCRINPLEDNFRVYKVVDGKRSQIQSEKIETKTGQWYEVRAVMTGDHIECFVDGKPYLHAHDDTFKEAGMIGLWTKADASSVFDNVAVYAAPSESGK